MLARMLAFIRRVSPSMGECELTHLSRTAIDVSLAERQHDEYARLLVTLGCRLVEVAAAPEQPDAVFVEDAAVVVPEIAVVTRPGAVRRRAEVEGVAVALAPWRDLARIEAPGTLDGGDVLIIGRNVYVGRTARTNDAGIAQLAAILERFDYRITAVPVTGCLHLKTAVTRVGPETLLINDAFVPRTPFAGMQFVTVAAGEPYAANALWIGTTVLHPASQRATRARLTEAGIDVVPVNVSEVEKAEGGVTCCSVILDHRTGQGRARDGCDRRNLTHPH